MCGRYHLDEFWNLNEMLERLRLGVADIHHDLFLGSKEVFPRTFQPIIRLEDGAHVVEKRRWGFHRTWPDPAKPDKWIKRELINAVGATVHKLPTFRKAYNCMVGVAGARWYENPCGHLHEGKQCVPSCWTL